jgi:hypothetical protein
MQMRPRVSMTPSMTGQRRLSQAISEGDAISLIVPAADLESAQLAESLGAGAVIVDRGVEGIRGAIAVPIVARTERTPAEAVTTGADAYVVPAERLDGDGEELEGLYAEARGAGLECVVEVLDADGLEHALEELDPEIFLLSPRGGNGAHPLERVLDLLPDVPAGKLAIADLEVASRGEVEELERAGFDAVIVTARDLAGLVAAAPPEV